ncbi:2'-5' RNA ligase family protein [Nocardia sp. 004]|uniref:2'-5' RNA ligase family protein n=1 Tax=Nocardia sp. 004 TaxID=3385978 RepID=UPI0039A14FFB
MVQSVELLLDDAADTEIRRQWRMLTEAGVPSLATHTAESNRPHITAVVARQIWPRIEKALDQQAFSPVQVRLGGLVIFGARRLILVRLVVPCEPLLALHRQLFHTMCPCPGIPANVHPDAWTPHITLARRVSTEQLGTAIRAVAHDRDFPATVLGIRRWDGEQRREWRVGRIRRGR